MDRFLKIITKYPLWIVAGWLAVAVVFATLEARGTLDLTRLAAEGQAQLLPKDVESAEAADFIKKAWPDQEYDTVAVAVLSRPSGLTAEDRAYAARFAEAMVGPEHPKEVLRVLGPGSRPEIAKYLISRDGTTELLVGQLSTSFVAPVTFEAVAWLEKISSRLEPPPGLKVSWTGDAVLGRDYLLGVQRSLDRAAIATVGLLLIVLLLVYHSVLLAMVPLATIGVGLVIARGVLAALARSGWAMSPLVELFLVVILFGCGTDFCLFLSWRFGEHWNAANPAGAMRTTMRRAVEPLLTSAGTVIAGLSLMGLTRFKLFSTTGPSVALGLAISVAATLSLTPALLVLLARLRPRSFAGLTAPASGIWNKIGRLVLIRPVSIWIGTVLVLVVVSTVGFQIHYLHDLAAELPPTTPAVQTLRMVADKFGAGRIAPLTVLLQTQKNFRDSQGLAMIDDVSRLLTHQRRLLEVRSATQPLGSSQPLDPARLDARLRSVSDGLQQMVSGASRLSEGLSKGVNRLRAARLIEKYSGISLTGLSPSGAGKQREALVSGMKTATGAMLGIPGLSGSTSQPKPEQPKPALPDNKTPTEPPLDQMIKELSQAADGASQIAGGAERASEEITEILNDPVGRQALNRLLVTPKNVREHPELLESFNTYISNDGHLARLDLVQADRLFSSDALDQVLALRRQIREWLGEMNEQGGHPGAAITGANAVAADTRALTAKDQVLSWIIVPTGVFFILLITLRDPLACLNLIATMVLTYLFALGVTHLVFVTVMHASGLDWKVPYFLFVLLIAVGVDYNIFLMTRLREEAAALGLRAGINRAIAQTGGLISSAAAITACSFAALLFSPLSSLRQLGLALVVGITIDALLVRPILVPCGHWLLNRDRERRKGVLSGNAPTPAARPALARVRE